MTLAARPWRRVRPMGVMIGAGLALAACAGPLWPVMRAAWLWLTPNWEARIPRPSGPAPVSTRRLLLPATDGRPDPIAVRIWSPDHPVCPSDGKACDSTAPKPVLIYAPGLGGAEDDNRVNAADLASHGYVVVAFADIDHGRPSTDTTPKGLTDFDLSSRAAFRTTYEAGTRKARQQAARAGAILDRLATREESDAAAWPGPLRLGRVGFFGWSFGGATAIEAAMTDPRVVAAANMDGWLFGNMAGARHAAILNLASDYRRPARKDIEGPDGTATNTAIFDSLDLREKIRAASQPNRYFRRFAHSRHESFADAIFERAFWRAWLRGDPVRLQRRIADTLLAFFDVALRDQPASRLSTMHPGRADRDYLRESDSWDALRLILKAEPASTKD